LAHRYYWCDAVNDPNNMKHIAIFASGNGSNAQVIINHFKEHPHIKVSLVLTNNPSAGVLKIAQQEKIISAILSKEAFQDEANVSKILKALQIDYIILAGFLQKVPDFVVQQYKNKIVNIHPALLPKYGGKGMYGQKVHEAVIADKATQTGITIHLVNEKYDDGTIILQKEIAIDANDTPKTIGEKVQQLEHAWYSQAIESLINN
jgi:phosphoribosylglycinamide formyltransferase-1